MLTFFVKKKTGKVVKLKERMNTSFKSLALTALVLAPSASAFAPQTSLNRNVMHTRLNAATVGGDFLAGAKKSLFPQAPQKKEDDDDQTGAMPDLTGIAFSVSFFLQSKFNEMERILLQVFLVAHSCSEYF